MDDLSGLRKQIDQIDCSIQELLSKRFLLSQQVGIYKKEHGIHVLDSKREEEIINKIEDESVRTVYLTILKASKDLQL